MNEPPPGARTITVAAERLARWLDGFDDRHGRAEVVIGKSLVTVVGSDDARAWIDVPFEPFDGSTRDELVEHVIRSRRVGVLLVRRGGYAAGVFEGREIVASKVGSSYVQGGTKAGGWSQQRYARRRANQAGAAFAEAADTAARVFGDQSLDAFVTGGDKTAVRAVLDDPRLAHLEASGPWLQVKDPRLRILAATPEQFRAVRIHLDP